MNRHTVRAPFRTGRRPVSASLELEQLDGRGRGESSDQTRPGPNGHE